MDSPAMAWQTCEVGMVRATGALQAFRAGTTKERVKKMFGYLRSVLILVVDRRGVTALEYAMIAGIIVAVVAVGFGILASDMSNQFNNFGNSL